MDVLVFDLGVWLDRNGLYFTLELHKALRSVCL